MVFMADVRGLIDVRVPKIISKNGTYPFEIAIRRVCVLFRFEEHGRGLDTCHAFYARRGVVATGLESDERLRELDFGSFQGMVWIQRARPP